MADAIFHTWLRPTLAAALDFIRLEQAYRLARNMSKDPQVAGADRVCCHLIAILIREASGDAAATWESAELAPARK